MFLFSSESENRSLGLILMISNYFWSTIGVLRVLGIWSRRSGFDFLLMALSWFSKHCWASKFVLVIMNNVSLLDRKCPWIYWFNFERWYCYCIVCFGLLVLIMYPWIGSYKKPTTRKTGRRWTSSGEDQATWLGRQGLQLCLSPY